MEKPKPRGRGANRLTKKVSLLAEADLKEKQSLDPQDKTNPESKLDPQFFLGFIINFYYYLYLKKKKENRTKIQRTNLAFQQSPKALN